jgi:acyl-CoA dehydrogenase family member 9
MVRNTGFLEKMCLGTLDERIFRSFQRREDTPGVRRVVAGWLAIMEEYPSERIEAEGRIPEGMLARMKEEGMFGLSIPRIYGGSGFTLREYLRTVEELVKLDISVAMASLAHLSIGVKGIQLFGNSSQKEKYLVPAASGEMIFSYALTEPRTGSDAQHIETRAQLSQDGSHYLLNGHKTYITNANYAGGLTVFARMAPERPGFMGAFIVETACDGVKVGKDMPKMGLKASSTAAIQFRNVRVPVENLLGSPGDGFGIAMTVLNYGRLGLGAASVGMMEKSFDDMMNRSSSRIQFGSPIGEFPLIQEKIVRTRTNLLVSSSMNQYTASILDETPLANLAMETSHCKLFGTTRAWDAVYDALQVAGGAGYLSTLPYEKRMRDFRVATVFEGTTEIHSIYPALFMVRQIIKRLRASKGDRKSQIAFFLANVIGKTDWPMMFGENTMRRASCFAGRITRSLRRMLTFGILLHGKNISEKQYLLRRISTLSLYLFAVVAVLSKMSADGDAGALEEEDIEMLDRFLEEAGEARKENARILDSRKERLNAAIFRRFLHKWKEGAGRKSQ